LTEDFEADKLKELCSAHKTHISKDGDEYVTNDYPTQLSALKYLGKLKRGDGTQQAGPKNLLGVLWVAKK